MARTSCVVIVMGILAGASPMPAADLPGSPSTQPSAERAVMPATSPSSRPAAAADQTTPRGAIKVLETAMNKGSAKGILAVIHTTVPLEDRVAKSFAYNVAAKVSLQHAMQAKFPEPGVDAVAEDAREMVEMMDRIDSMEEVVTGDDAVVGVSGGGPEAHLQLHRVGGQWKVPFSVMFTGLADVDQRIEQLDIQSRVFTELARQVMGDKFHSVEELQDAGKQQMLAAMLAQATSRPATRPAATLPSATTRP
jgi:hypothetical protein